MANIVKNQISLNHVKWINECQKDVTIIIIKHLIEKAILKETTSIIVLDSLIKDNFKSILDSEQNILETIHTSLTDIWKWEVSNSRPPLSSLILRTSGSDKGIPSRGFWKEYGFESSSLKSKLAMLQVMHKNIFDYYDVCVYEHTFTRKNLNTDSPYTEHIKNNR